MSLNDEKDYVYVRREVLKRVKIPAGNVKCPACKGRGELRIYYGSPHDRGQFQTCWYCHGDGYVEEKWAEELKKRDDFWIKRNQP